MTAATVWELYDQLHAERVAAEIEMASEQLTTALLDAELCDADFVDVLTEAFTTHARVDLGDDETVCSCGWEPIRYGTWEHHFSSEVAKLASPVISAGYADLVSAHDRLRNALELLNRP